MSNGYVLPYFENKFNVKSKRLILKYFGDLKKLNEVLKSAKDGKEGIQFNVTTLNGDTTVDLLFDGDMENVSRDFVREVVENLKENIYAEFDTTLGERLFDLLKLRKVKLSVAESFTGGRVVSELIKNSGASEFIDEGVVTYSNQSKMKRLSVKKIDLDTSGAVSSIVAYQMAVGLLNGGECDLAIATTGIAGPKSDNTEKPVGLCYIAVGMRDGVHTYRYVFKGDREEITETAKNTALFLAIKKLKNM
jgi:nicotinamide-nucleotide amidase